MKQSEDVLVGCTMSKEFLSQLSVNECQCNL